MTKANYIRTIRLQLKLSLNQSANQLGISRNSLRKYEFLPLFQIPRHILLQLSNLYKTSPAELLNSPKDHSFIASSIFVEALNEPKRSDSIRWLNTYLNYQICYTADEIAHLYQTLDQRGRHLVSRLIQMESKFKSSETTSAIYHKES